MQDTSDVDTDRGVRRSVFCLAIPNLDRIGMSLTYDFFYLRIRRGRPEVTHGLCGGGWRKCVPDFGPEEVRNHA